jgi:chromosome segregation ATPase
LSKAEETALLEKLVENLRMGSYLRNFMSDQAVSWLKQQIRDDAACDLYENWTMTQADLSEAQGQIRELRSQLAKSEESLEHAKQFGADYRKQIEDLHIEVQAGKDHIQALQWTAQEGEANHAAALMVKDTAINALKVEVYDLTHANK